MKLRNYFLIAPVFIASLSVASDHKAHWSYSGEHGAGHWGEMEGFETCKIGKVQSPINIVTKSVKKGASTPINFHYKPTQATIINNGHTIQVNIPEGQTIEVGGKTYSLLQFHFHAPSEEGFDQKRFPMVAHLVHKSNDGQLAVVAVLIKAGEHNGIFKRIFDELPKSEEEKSYLAKLNLDLILPEEREYYKFDGSLTTPPCTEGVKWHVLKNPVELSSAQIKAFQKLYPMNARPLQKMNDREIILTE